MDMRVDVLTADSRGQAPVVMVDDVRKWPGAKVPFHRGSCHLTVDGLTEQHLEALHALASAIGLKRSWFQAHKLHPHYDLTPSKRAFALEAGAVYVDASTQARDRIRRYRGEP